MNVQIELTTRCNFDCFYCVGRDMRQADMTYDEFVRIIDRHVSNYGLPRQVSLQGEGEPTLHKRFFNMARNVREIGSRPYTITNGTCKHPELFFESFDEVGVSVDTLNSNVAEKIGRYNLPRVLNFIDRLADKISVTIYTVSICKDLPAIQKFCRERKLRHVVQPLQPKPDYAYRYPEYKLRVKREGTFYCSYLALPRIRYYALDGTELPCCFIKDTSGYEGVDALINLAKQGIMPSVCKGCIYGQKRPKVVQTK